MEATVATVVDVVQTCQKTIRNPSFLDMNEVTTVIASIASPDVLFVSPVWPDSFSTRSALFIALPPVLICVHEQPVLS